MPGTPSPAPRSTWPVPLLLLALAVVPLVAGGVRMAGVLAATPAGDNARFLAAPAPILVHFLAAALYAVVGAFQFSAGVRRRWPRWHRLAGRVAAGAGVVVGLTGTWMVATYQVPPAHQGPLLAAARWVVGPATAGMTVLGVLAIRRRDVARHQAWMIRAFALAQGAGTQVLFLGVPAVFLGELQGFPRDLLMTSSWAFNAAFAEWLIRRGRPAPGPGRLAAASPTG